MIEETWFLICILFPVLIGLLYSMIKTADMDFFSLMWLIGLIRELWMWNEVLLMSFPPCKIAIRTRVSSESVYLFPFSLQVHSPWALCGQSPSLLHQDLCEIQEEHRCKFGHTRFSRCVAMGTSSHHQLFFCFRSCTIIGLKATAQPSVISATKQLNVTRAWRGCTVFGVRPQWVTRDKLSWKGFRVGINPLKS